MSMTTMKLAFETAPATDAQKSMIRKLVAKKATPENPIMTDAEIEALLKVEIDAKKNYLFSLPWPKKVSVDAPAAKEAQKSKFDMYEDIPDGNYAYLYNGKTHFYRVSRSEGKGKWEGQTFVNVQERASDELFKIYNYSMKKSVLDTIRTMGVKESQKFFAEKLGRCCKCFKLLTDEFNPYKSMGFGPECGSKI